MRRLVDVIEFHGSLGQNDEIARHFFVLKRRQVLVSTKKRGSLISSRSDLTYMAILNIEFDFDTQLHTIRRYIGAEFGDMEEDLFQCIFALDKTEAILHGRYDTTKPFATSGRDRRHGFIDQRDFSREELVSTSILTDVE